MKISSLRFSLKMLCVLCAIMLLASIYHWPIAYYTLLRAVVFTGALLVVFLLKPKPFWWRIIFVIIALIFNPIVPIYLYKKAYWIPIDIVSGALFLWTTVFKQKNSSTPPTQKASKTYSRDKIY